MARFQGRPYDWKRTAAKIAAWLAGVAVVGAVAIVLLPRGDGAVDIPASASFAPTTFTPAPTPDPITLGAQPRVLIFGDSYTAGYGSANPASDSFAAVLPRYLEGWEVTVEGVGSTGYLKAGNDGQGTFQQRLDALTYGDEFQLVILQGGSNDQNVENAGLAEAVDSTVQTLRAHFPSAQLLMLGPVSVSTSSNANKRYVDQVLREYAAEQRIEFISPLSETWFPTSSQPEWVNIELGHPNTAGYDHMAQKLAEDLRAIIVPV